MMDKQELKNILDEHKKWVQNEGGKSADLGCANLYGAKLRDADLRKADLAYADLREADLTGADLMDADLSEANLTCADLRYTNLSGADLTCANLWKADLRGANLRGAKLPSDWEEQIKERENVNKENKSAIAQRDIRRAFSELSDDEKLAITKEMMDYMPQSQRDKLKREEL
jgi:uncharacterized protein YjbI with pentapeptide repeats